MIKQILLRSFTLILVLGLLTTTLTYGTATAESPQLSSEELYELELDNWINKVINEESHGRWDVEIIDTNGKHSRGCLQFQDATWRSYTKKYSIDGSPLNCETAKKVAKAMIKDNYGLWRSWWTTVVKKGVGKPPVLADFVQTKDA